MLKFKIASLDDVEEGFRSFYEVSEAGGFQLKVEGLEDVSGLKNKNSELIGKLQREKEERERLSREAEDLARKQAEDKGEYEKLYKEMREKLREKEEETARERSARIERENNEFAMALAQELSGELGHKQVQLMKKELLAYVKTSETGPYFEIGGFKVEQDTIKNRMETEYPFLCAGNKSSGGQATGSSGKAGTGERNPWKKETLNITEQARISKDDPALADRLKAQAK